MKMSKGRCIGVMAVIGVSCMLALLILLIVSPLLMLGVLMAGMLLTALLWRIRPKWFRAIGRVFAQEKSMPDVGRSLSREVIISDMVLWSMHDGREQIIHLNKKLIVVGLAEGCDVVLPRDCGVSRVHAKVFYSSRNKQFLVEDNNSSSGTYLNDMRLSKGEPQVLCKGDRLRFAQMEYIVKSAYYK
ncbi:MAG: FHA domain-containing protein [Clostridia bacterium]|nr:FHA domain-containing protein [Clostridia bacterium]